MGGFISSGSSDPSSNIQLIHQLTDVSSKNGLVFNGENINVLTPNKTDDVAHIQNVKIKATSISNTSILGDTTKTINFQVKNRNESLANDDNYLANVTKVIGRFAEELIPSDTRLMEDFSSERYRWIHNTNFSNSSTDFTGTTNPNYNSETDIASTVDLQQTITEKLIYPIDNFNSVTSFPNSRDYSTSQAMNDRYYYRAFEFQGQTSATELGDFSGSPLGNIQQFNIEITSNFTQEEMINDTGDIESLGVKVDIRLPGITEWGVVTSTQPKSGVSPGTVTSEGWQAFNGNLSIISDGDKLIIPLTLRAINLSQSNGVVLIRVRLKSNVVNSKEITKIEFIP